MSIASVRGAQAARHPQSATRLRHGQVDPHVQQAKRAAVKAEVSEHYGCECVDGLVGQELVQLDQLQFLVFLLHQLLDQRG